MKKDKIQQDLQIGDRVVFNPPRYKGLIFGVVTGFAPKMARVSYDWQGYQRLTSVFYHDLVKVPQV